jgi:WhiB family redox-sensing transcriptional regulator
VTAVNLNPPSFHPWMSEAACSEYPGDMWFVEEGGRGHLEDAKRICNGCPVQAECLTAALANKEVHGMWAGKTARQLRTMRNDGSGRWPKDDVA